MNTLYTYVTNLSCENRYCLLIAVLFAFFSALAYPYFWNQFHPRMHHLELQHTPIGMYERWVRRNHTLHHLQKGDLKGNHNILLPFADYKMGIYRTCVDNREYFKSKKEEQLTKKEIEIKRLFNEKPKEVIMHDVYFCS